MIERDWRWLQGAAVLVVLAAFLFSLRPILSPFLVFLLLLLVLMPYAGTRLHLLVVTGAALLTLLWLLETTGFLLAPFVLALALAYILNPAVDALERRRLPRVLAIVLLALPVLALLAITVALGVPALVDQIEEVIEQAPIIVRRVTGWVEGLRTRIGRIDLPFVREDLELRELPALDPQRIVAYLQERQQALARAAWQGVLGVGRGVGFAITLIGYLVLTPVLTFYLLRDYHGLGRRLGELIPLPHRERWLAFSHEYNTLLSRYLRGQILAAAVVGVLTWLGLWLVGFPYSGLVGAVAGVFNLVPYLGLVVSVIPAVIISLLSGAIFASLLKVAVIFAIVQFLDGAVIGPRIVGGSVGLHPVLVMLALVVGGFFFGFVGLLIAMPVAVLLKLLVRAGMDRYRRSTLYLGGGGTSAP